MRASFIKVFNERSSVEKERDRQLVVELKKARNSKGGNEEGKQKEGERQPRSKCLFDLLNDKSGEGDGEDVEGRWRK